MKFKKRMGYGGSYIDRTRATRQVLTNVNSGVHTYFIKTKIKLLPFAMEMEYFSVQGNESAGTASVSVTVLVVSTETLIANNNFSTGTHIGTNKPLIVDIMF